MVSDKKIFMRIGSYVKLSSAVEAILEGDHPRIISAYFG
jgi:hypothetical protein